MTTNRMTKVSSYTGLSICSALSSSITTFRSVLGSGQLPIQEVLDEGDHSILCPGKNVWSFTSIHSRAFIHDEQALKQLLSFHINVLSVITVISHAGSPTILTTWPKTSFWSFPTPSKHVAWQPWWVKGKSVRVSGGTTFNLLHMIITPWF
jgi:hypothetical protein